MAEQVTEAQWWDLVGKWKKAAADFDQRYQALMAQERFVSQRPALLREWRKLVESGNRTRSQITSAANALKKVTGGAAAAWDWLKSKTGLGDVGGLGILPLLPVAAIAAAIGAVSKWVLDARAFDKRLAEQQRLEQQGLSPDQASKIVVQTAQGEASGVPMLSFMGFRINPVLLVGAALVVALPIVLRQRKEEPPRSRRYYV